MINNETRRLKAEVKVAEMQMRKEIVLGLISQPIISLVAGVATIEYLERRGYIGNVIATTTEAGMILVCVAQAVAPIRTEMAQALVSLAPALGLAK